MSTAVLSANPHIEGSPAATPVEYRHPTAPVMQPTAILPGLSSIVELKNGRLVLKQKPFSLERVVVTMKELVAFNEMFENLTVPLETIPPEHLPLIAKLACESDKTLAGLARKLKTIILPQMSSESQGDNDASTEDRLPQFALEQAIRNVCERVNYGIDDASAALALWRWEVKDFNILPPDVRDKAAKRRQEREQARRDVCDLLGGLADGGKLDASPRAAVVPIKSVDKVHRDRQKENQTPEPRERSVDGSLSNSGEGNTIKSAGRPKKELDAEQLAVAREREEKAAVKAEKKRKAGMEQMKAAANMTAWLGKGAGKPKVSMSTTKSSLAPKSDFDLVFKPFVQKKDTEIAPINKLGGKGHQNEPITIDCDGDTDMDQPNSIDAKPDRLLLQFLATVPAHRRLPTPVPKRRTEAKHSVRELMAQITEAGVIGDSRLVRQLQATLSCGRKVPVKLLQFHDNARPAYFGTWTKPSSFVGPTMPFAKDIATFDYSYDSGDDWNDEGGGDDVVSDAGSTGDTPELDSDEDEDEFAGWMVDDDEVEEVEVVMPPSDFDWPMPPPPPPKRKRATSQEPRKKGRFDTPLIPYSKGPYWETTLGIPEYNPFLDYRIQLLNDTPLPLDPFTFMAPEIKEENNSAPTSFPPQAAPIPSAGPIVPIAFAKAARPEQELSVKPRSNNPVQPPKHPFPDNHLRALLDAIEGSTKTRAALTDLLYDRFKPEGVKKNAIEAKMKEVCSKQNKVWKVSPEAWTQAGGAPATLL